MIKELSILGFRGFATKQTIKFAVPDGQTPGSGLSIITGSNNSGKTTIVESIRAFNGYASPSFSEGRRNIQAGGKVELKITDHSGKEITIVSKTGGGSSTTKTGERCNFYIIPSRRAIPFEFNRASGDRDYYVSNTLQLDNQRAATLHQYEMRIFQMENDKEEFNSVIRKVLGPSFQWTVEQRDSGSYYIKYTDESISHSSEGVGDGIWSIFTICGALFDAPPNSVIVIDEPELSVHPALQKKLISLLLEYSIERQIIICTHSPYFIEWKAIADGAELIRIVKEGQKSVCYSLSNASRSKIKGILNDLNNPHALGIEASEAFFLTDGIILVEGQEDVVIYNKIAQKLEMSFKGTFFGWGAGGASRIETFLTMFKDLGYKHVVAIFDGDKKAEADKTKKNFPEYCIEVLSADDIRDKKARTIVDKVGIADEKGNLKKAHFDYMKKFIENINCDIGDEGQ